MPSFPFLNRSKNPLEQGGRSSVHARGGDTTAELSQQCPNCRKHTELSRLWNNLNTCDCGYHFRIKAADRIGFVTDPGSFVAEFESLLSVDPLDFPGYIKKLETNSAISGQKEAVICGRATIEREPCRLFAMDPYFMMGSMGSVVGEKITRTFEAATEEKMPVVGFTVSGGARMQEGLLSLMQMAKTSAAVKRHSDAGLFYLAFLTDPTTGGVMASFAMQGDIILAEPGATAGFAGARVIEQTVHKKLPPGFQTSEFLLEHGFLDAIVSRKEQRKVISRMLRIHRRGDLNE